MKEEYFKWYSPNLSQDIEMLVFGHAGYPVILFPTSMGSFHENKDMGLIDWNSPAFEVANKIKALNPAPGCFTFINGKRLKLWMAESLEESSSVQPGTIVAITADSIDVATKDGILRLKEVQPDNKKRMSAGDFSRGHQLKVGMTFGE